MKIYRIKEVSKKGIWESPFLATFEIADKIIQSASQGKFYVTEYEVDDSGESAFKNYSIDQVFNKEPGSGTSRSIGKSYEYGSKEYIKKLKDKHTLGENLLNSISKLNGDVQMKQDLYEVVAYDPRTNKSGETYSYALNYLTAREIAIRFNQSSKNTAIRRCSLYADDVECVKDISRGMLFEDERKQSAFVVGSPIEEEIYERELRIAELENKIEKEKNPRIR